MSPELEKVLIATFPKLYAQVGWNIMSTAMCWGFECQTGWFLILWELSEAIEAINNKRTDNFRFEAIQVKEKYGGLRFYMTGYTDEISKLIRKAEDRAAFTCEVCGRPGRLNDGGWLMVRCGTHRNS